MLKRDLETSIRTHTRVFGLGGPRPVKVPPAGPSFQNRGKLPTQTYQSVISRFEDIESWVAPAAIMLVAQYLFAVLLNAYLGVSIRPPILSYCALGLLVAVLVEGSIVFIRAARKHLKYADLLHATLGLQFIALQIGVLTWLKAMLPMLVPFWADPYLASADAWLLGADAWTFLFRLPAWFDLVIHVVYYSWLPLHLLFVLAVLHAPASTWKSQCVLAFFAIWAIGCVAQFALSSAGPVFFEEAGFGLRFEGMPVSRTTTLTADYLWQSYQSAGANVGTGISAMPSMHVALSAWMAFVLAGRTAGLIRWGYFTIIVIGSVYLGWHYALDAVGAVGVAIAGWAIAWTIGRASA